MGGKADKFQNLDLDIVKVRIGLVFCATSLKRYTPIKYYLGSPLGVVIVAVLDSSFRLS